ncbi:MAG: ComF family protein [Acidimicrobiales bacterium]
MLFPRVCPVCGVVGPAPCPPCRRLLLPPAEPPRLAGFEACAALFAYTGAAASVVAGLKYRNARSALAWLADALAALVSASCPPPALVTWAPTTPGRARARGFDHAELLARALARRLPVPAAPTLERGHGPPQTGRTRRERQGGVSFAWSRSWRAPSAARLAAGPVLVVDDVITTGATLTAAGALLRAHGAASLCAAALAVTPKPG